MSHTRLNNLIDSEGIAARHDDRIKKHAVELLESAFASGSFENFDLMVFQYTLPYWQTISNLEGKASDLSSSAKIELGKLVTQLADIQDPDVTRELRPFLNSEVYNVIRQFIDDKYTEHLTALRED